MKLMIFKKLTHKAVPRRLVEWGPSPGLWGASGVEIGNFSESNLDNETQAITMPHSVILLSGIYLKEIMYETAKMCMYKTPAVLLLINITWKR